MGYREKGIVGCCDPVSWFYFDLAGGGDVKRLKARASFLSSVVEIWTLTGTMTHTKGIYTSIIVILSTSPVSLVAERCTCTSRSCKGHSFDSDTGQFLFLVSLICPFDGLMLDGFLFCSSFSSLVGTFFVNECNVLSTVACISQFNNAFIKFHCGAIDTTFPLSRLPATLAVVTQLYAKMSLMALIISITHLWAHQRGARPDALSKKLTITPFKIAYGSHETLFTGPRRHF